MPTSYLTCSLIELDLVESIELRRCDQSRIRESAVGPRPIGFARSTFSCGEAALAISRAVLVMGMPPIITQGVSSFAYWRLLLDYCR
jgi:hypothetical protein